MKRNQGLIAFLFIFPYMLIFFMFRLLPSIGSLLISLTDWKIIGAPNFVGLKNYISMFQDKNFFTALANNFRFLLIVLPVLLFASLFVAIALNGKLKGRNLVRTIAIIPYVIIPAVVGVMWNWIYDANFGILNYLLSQLGVDKVGWLIDKSYALPAVAVVVIWSYLGYNMILYLAGLQGINKELFEASQIDGATKWQQFRYITWPLLRSTTSLLITLTLINVMQVYDQVVVMTGGGPRGATMTLIQYQYIAGFEKRNMGYSATVGVAILAILIVLVGVQKRLFKADEGREG